MLYESAEPIPPDSPALQIGMRYTTPGSEFATTCRCVLCMCAQSTCRLTSTSLATLRQPVQYRAAKGAFFGGVALELVRSANQQPHVNYRYLTDPFDRERLARHYKAMCGINGKRRICGCWLDTDYLQTMMIWRLTMRSIAGC